MDAGGSLAGDEIRLAVIGLNGRGMTLINNFLQLGLPDAPVADVPPARLVAICDVDTAVLGRTAKHIEETYGQTVETDTEYERILERRDIDAVVITTPNHWHALQTIWAVEAGKGCLRGEACLLFLVGGPANEGGRQTSQTDRPVRIPKPLRYRAGGSLPPYHFR